MPLVVDSIAHCLTANVAPIAWKFSSSINVVDTISAFILLLLMIQLFHKQYHIGLWTAAPQAINLQRIEVWNHYTIYFKE
jgi:hypothetical protein